LLIAPERYGRQRCYLDTVPVVVPGKTQSGIRKPANLPRGKAMVRESHDPKACRNPECAQEVVCLHSEPQPLRRATATELSPPVDLPTNKALKALKQISQSFEVVDRIPLVQVCARLDLENYPHRLERWRRRGPPAAKCCWRRPTYRHAPSALYRGSLETN
jgi:hypothetical protein